MAKNAARTYRRVRTSWRLFGACVLANLVCVIAVGAAAASSSQPSAKPAVGSEVVGLRTADSRTFVGANGALVAHIYGGPVNYQDTSGAWQPIDNTLVSGAGGFENAANRFHIHLPRILGTAPVRVSDGSQWVSCGTVACCSSSHDSMPWAASPHRCRSDSRFPKWPH